MAFLEEHSAFVHKPQVTGSSPVLATNSSVVDRSTCEAVQQHDRASRERVGGMGKRIAGGTPRQVPDSERERTLRGDTYLIVMASELVMLMVIGSPNSTA